VLFLSLLPFLLLVLAGAGLWYANSKFHELRRVPVGALLNGGGHGTNILMVGSDSRAGTTDESEGIAGQRSDTIMVLHMGAGGDKVLSIPRDLIVTLADTGRRDRINAAYNTDLGGGPARLLKTVQQTLNIPINRYMEVDFATFQGVVDAIGGITIDFPNPAFDDNSGLFIDHAGPNHLNGEQALAYVRSRHYTETINGKKVEDPTADLGRVKRQQAFLQAVFGKIGGSRNPFTLLNVGGKVAKGLAVDDKLGLWDAIRLGWDLKGVHPEAVPLPVLFNNDGATLRLDANQAPAVLTQFR
jgi:LCP family protein required for cell wall assembly